VGLLAWLQACQYIDLEIDQGGGQTAACGTIVVGTPYAKSWSCESLGSQALCAHPASTALLQSTHILRSLCHIAQTEPERQPNAPAVKSARTTTKLLQKRSVFSGHYIDVLQIQLAIPYDDEAAAAAAVLLAAAAVSSGHEPSVQMPPSK